MKKVWYMTLAVAAIISTSGFAQPSAAEPTDRAAVKEVRNEVSVWGLGGVSSFLYSPTVGSATPGIGYGGGIGVGRFFNPNFGLRFGLEFMTYATDFNAPTFTTSYVCTNGSGENFDFRSEFSNYKEKQKAMMLNIPVVASYERGMFYAQLGLKAGLSLSATYTATADAITMKGIYEGLPEKDFATTDPYYTKHSGNIKLGFGLALTAEAGAKWKLSNKLNLYTGIYADYGLINVVSLKNEDLINYLESNVLADAHHYNSVLNSALKTTVGTEHFTNRVGIFGAGVKVALGVNTATLFAAADKEDANDAYASDQAQPYLTATPSEAPAEEEVQDEQKQVEQEPAESAKEKEKAAKAAAKAQEKAAKEKAKAEKQAAKERAKLTPREQQMEEEIAEVKRVQETLLQQAEATNRNQEAILGAVKAAQEAATAAADAARTAQAAVMNMQGRGKAAEKRPATARKDAGGLVLKIQISARRFPLDDINEPFAKYALGMKITEEQHEDEQGALYKYVVGSYRQVDAAVEACNEVRSKGIKDAFVVAYHKGNRISMAEAYALLNKQ